VSAAAGILYLMVVALGGWLMVPRQGASSPVDLLICRLITGFALFFFGFEVPAAIRLFTFGKWMTFANAIPFVLAVAVAGCVWSRRHRPIYLNQANPSTNQLSVLPFDPTARLVIALVGGGFLLLAGLLVIGFPRGYEANAYHLPNAVNFFRDGSLQIWDAAFMHTYPADASLWNGFWLRLLPERVVSVVNLPFLGLCVLLLYQLCRCSGADRSAAVLVSCGLTTISLFGFCAAELGSDVAGVAFSLAALWLALSRPQLFPRWSVLAGTASGIAYSFKQPHLVSTVLVGLLIVGGRAPSGMRQSLSTRLAHGLSFAAGFMALAGEWLLRNQLELGNPFYPLPLAGVPEFLGFTSASDWSAEEFRSLELEWVDAPWQWLTYPWVEGHRLHQNFKFSSGLGPFFAATVPVMWIMWSVMLIREAWRYRSSSDCDRTARVLYLCGTALFLAWWASGSRQPRFAMIGIATLLPLAAVLLTSISGWLRRAYEILLGFGILFMLLVLLVNIGVEEGSLLSLGRLPTRAEAFEYPPRIDDLPDGSVVLDLVGRPFHYQLYGARLTNRVVSYPEAVRLFREGDAWNFRANELHRLGVSYAYALGVPTVARGCVRLEPDAQLDHNPFNNERFAKPRVLYRVVDDCPGSASR
jgi:hypothetical protein